MLFDEDDFSLAKVMLVSNFHILSKTRVYADFFLNVPEKMLQLVEAILVSRLESARLLGGALPTSHGVAPVEKGIKKSVFFRSELWVMSELLR